jgi:uncharacterized protein (TIGR02452 family)
MRLADVTAETLTIFDAGGYRTAAGGWVDLRAAIAAAVAGTRLYTPAALAALVDGPGRSRAEAAPTVEVTAETTSAAARRLAATGPVCALNFASAKNPGGGFLGSARAQEEDLCRGSALYPTLLAQPGYYDANRATASMLYTDHLIYSPAVPFFRDDDGALLPTAFRADVITSPAPNAGEALRREPGAGPAITATLTRRAATILAVAEAAGARRLILGAWGCGVFRNAPAEVAAIFARHLAAPRFAGAFTHVTFAIYDRSAGQTTLAAFRAAFAAQS